MLYHRESHSPELKAQAHRLLDDAVAGLNISPDRINWALRITGDFSGNVFELCDSKNQFAKITPRRDNQRTEQQMEQE